MYALAASEAVSHMQHEVIVLAVVSVVVGVSKNSWRVAVGVLRTICEVEHGTQVESCLEPIFEERAHDIYLRVFKVPFSMALWRYTKATLIAIGCKECHILVGPIIV